MNKTPENTTDLAFSNLENGVELGQAEKDVAQVIEKAKQLVSLTDGNGTYQEKEDGIYFVTTSSKGTETEKFISAPIHVIALTRNKHSGEWGYLLRWKDLDGVDHEWMMRAEMLVGTGEEAIKTLMNGGLSISQFGQKRILKYIQLVGPSKRALSLDRLGWHKGVYVLPDKTIGETEEKIIFQNNGHIQLRFSESGDVATWIQHVARFCSGNSRLEFAVSAAFASPLIEIAGMDSSGFHLRGASSSGKTTAMHVAASVYGHPKDHIRTWRATVNGLEGMAALHNDRLLILDELSEAKPKDVGETAYMLANGQGKTRAKRNGMAKEPFSWWLMFLSTGEESLSDIMSKAGLKSNAGQEIRLADIESDAGAGMGIFETIHDIANASDFAIMLKKNASLYHGAVGRIWIEKLVLYRSQLQEEISEAINYFVSKVVPEGAEGQVIRVARVFALVAYAGEKATEWDLTGWKKGDATKAAQACFTSWLENFGGAENREERTALEQIRVFIEQHGASRFGEMDGDDDRVIHNRAGFVRIDKETGEKEYLILPEVFKNEVCRGLNLRIAVRALYKHGCLKKGAGNSYQQAPRINALKKTAKVYVITSEIIK